MVAGQANIEQQSDAGEPAPVVSVVVSAYNAAAFIRATLLSVLRQTFPDFELIVVDDCSSDGTAAIVEEMASHDSRIRLVRLERNSGGPAGPRNIGVSRSRGEWIAFLDSDDIWHPDKLKLQLEVLKRTGASFCSGKMINFKDEKDLEFLPAVDPATETVRFPSLFFRNTIPASSVVVASGLARRHPFNEQAKYRAREDFDCWLHCHEEIGESVKILHPLVGYRVSARQISGNKLKMAGRHYHVLKEYRFRSGHKLGVGAGVFTLTHLALAVYHRLLLKEL